MMIDSFIFPSSMDKLVGPRSANPRSHVELGMLAQIICISLCLADVRHARVVVLFLEAIVYAHFVIFDAF